MINQGDRLTFGKDPTVWIVAEITQDANGFTAYQLTPEPTQKARKQGDEGSPRGTKDDPAGGIEV